MCAVCLSGLSQLADRLQPGDDFPVRVTFLQQGECHLFDGTGIEPVLGPIPELDLRTTIEPLPAVVVMTAIKDLLCNFRRHAIMVPEFGSDVGHGLYGTGMKVILQTSFPCQHGTATGAAVDLSNQHFPLLRLRRAFPIKEIKLREVEWGQPIDPGPWVTADR